MLERTVQDLRLNEAKAASNHAEEISDLRSRLALEREKTQLERERRDADKDLLHNGTNNCMAGGNVFNPMMFNPSSWYPRVNGPMLWNNVFRGKELWSNRIGKVNGRKMQYRKRYIPTDYRRTSGW